MGLRIAVSGTANTGKTTLIKDILTVWKNVKKSEFDYRSLIKDKSTHSKNTTPELQMTILDGMLAELRTWKKGESRIIDRCPLDNLVYTFWCVAQEIPGFDDAYLDIAIPKFQEAMSYIDVILFVPLTGKWDPRLEDDGKRETEEVYIKEIDLLFKQMAAMGRENVGALWPKDNIPGIIEVFGEREQRLAILHIYFDENMDLHGGNEEVEGFSEETIRQRMEQTTVDEHKLAAEAKYKSDQYVAARVRKNRGK